MLLIVVLIGYVIVVFIGILLIVVLIGYIIIELVMLIFSVNSVSSGQSGSIQIIIFLVLSLNVLGSKLSSSVILSE